MDKVNEITIPTPAISPFGLEVSSEGVKDVWDTFVVPAQSDDAPPQSIEMRTLMASLRSVHEGLRREEEINGRR